MVSEYEWKPCAGPGDAGGQVLYGHSVYEIILAEYEWKPCAGLGDAGGQVLYGQPQVPGLSRHDVSNIGLQVLQKQKQQFENQLKKLATT
jgi:hypothetical protein